uniref:Reverse transcriptase n=1 Tax=Tanacetum cinerariifolium TaxID=118510 RepID=A0A6L2MSV3_TANCI|nr:reverse transcriptase [Tanacetum cinerariifolium]
MAGELSELMRRVSMNEAKDEVVGYDGEIDNGGNNGLDKTLLGRIHSDRLYNFQRVKKALSTAWKPHRPITFKELDSNMVLIHIDYYLDFKRILENGPWRNKTWVRRIAAKLGDVIDVDDAYFKNRSKHIRANVMINILNPLYRLLLLIMSPCHTRDDLDNDDNESSDDDDDDDDVEKDGEDDKEEKHLASIDPSVVPIDDPVPLS